MKDQTKNGHLTPNMGRPKRASVGVGVRVSHFLSTDCVEQEISVKIISCCKRAIPIWRVRRHRAIQFLGHPFFFVFSSVSFSLAFLFLFPFSFMLLFFFFIFLFLFIYFLFSFFLLPLLFFIFSNIFKKIEHSFEIMNTFLNSCTLFKIMKIF